MPSPFICEYRRTMDLSPSVPMRTGTRTLVTAFLALALTSTLAACSGSDGATADDSAERTVEHAMGTTDVPGDPQRVVVDRKSTRLNSSHVSNSYAVFCLKK